MMQAMPYNLQGKGVVEIPQISASGGLKWKNIEEFGNHTASKTNSSSIDSEPTSILDTRRSPSPPTSTSTLSSSFNGRGSAGRSGGNNYSLGGGAGSTDDNLAGVAALSDSTQEKYPISLLESEPDPTYGGGGVNRREELAPALRNGLDIASSVGSAAGAGSERNTGGAGGGGALGLEEWESIFPGGDGTLLPWIMGEADELGSLGFKNLLQSAHSAQPFEGNGGGGGEIGGIIDHRSPQLDHISPAEGGGATVSGEASLSACVNSTSNLGFSSSGFNSSHGKLGPISPSCSSGVVVDRKISNGLNSNSSPHTNNNSFFTSLPNTTLPVPVSLQPGMILQQQQQHHFDVGDQKPQIFNPQLVLNQQQMHSIQNPSFLLPPLSSCQLEQHVSPPLVKRHNPGVVLDHSLMQLAKGGGGNSNSGAQFLDQGHEFLLRKQLPQLQQPHQFGIGSAHPLVPSHLQQKSMLMVPRQPQQQQQQQMQEQAVRDQLYKAADLIQTGNFPHAQEILARLNHQLSLPGKPLIRSAFYLKEALQLLLLMSNPAAAPPPKCLTPYDVVHKMSTYKVFSEVSPITQFINFSCTQAILEALDDADAIHIVDFDIGCGAQWASFLQELPSRKRGAPNLKITAIASPSSSHPFELALMRDNLMQFASDIGMALELQVVNFDSFDPSSSTMPNFHAAENESIAVCFPLWAASNRPYLLPSLLRFIKQRSPKIVVSFDRGCDRSDVPFAQHLIHALDSCSNHLESLDGLNVASDIVNKVEKFFIQPRIETAVLGRLQAPDKMPHWKNLFASAEFFPLTFSNFTETLVDYVVKRTPGRGFHVEKQQASLVLSWQRRVLVAASAWRC